MAAFFFLFPFLFLPNPFFSYVKVSKTVDLRTGVKPAGEEGLLFGWCGHGHISLHSPSCAGPGLENVPVGDRKL
jgi:hypothetical protein